MTKTANMKKGTEKREIGRIAVTGLLLFLMAAALFITSCIGPRYGGYGRGGGYGDIYQGPARWHHSNYLGPARWYDEDVQAD